MLVAIIYPRLLRVKLFGCVFTLIDGLLTAAFISVHRHLGPRVPIVVLRRLQIPSSGEA